MDENGDFEDLPEPPPEADPFAGADLGPPLDDDAAIRQMGSGTPWWAWGLLLVLVASVGGVGFVWWQQNQAYQHRWDEYQAAQTDATDVADFLRRGGAILPNTQYEEVKIRILQKMGEHRDAYPKLANDSTYACILRTEADLAGAELFYVPQDRIGRAYDSIHPGDIIATATSIGGLDVTHTGFVHKTAAHTGFMHASLASNEVKISDDLQSYVQGIRSQVGVVVVRPVDPRTEAPAGG